MIKHIDHERKQPENANKVPRKQLTASIRQKYLQVSSTSFKSSNFSFQDFKHFSVKCEGFQIGRNRWERWLENI